MASILVTGASGFIGRHVVRAVLAGGDEAVCLLRPSADRGALEALGARCVIGDMTDAASLVPALRGIDGVIHAAAMLKAPWRPEFASANIDGTANVAAACASMLTPPPLVVVSSLAAAGPAPGTAPRTEAMPATPISIYGRVKRDAERAAAASATAVPITIVRPPMVFGETDRSALTLFRAARGGWHPLPGGNNHRLSMVHAADLADLLRGALLNGERLPSSGADAGGQGYYYASADETPTLQELGAMIAAAMERPAPRVLPVPLIVLRTAAAFGELKGRITDRPQLMNLDKARELSSGPWLCSADKAKRTLGFAPAPLAVRLRQTADGYRERGWLRR